jgi:hypothetical protein
LTWTGLVWSAILSSAWPGTGLTTVDLHRNLSQKWPFLASKTDPSAVSQIFEMAAIRFV